MGMSVPGWLGGLVEESFFVGCESHESRRKNEKNIFCLDCCTSICPHCVPLHPHHPLLQVRRYVYNDVVRLDDLEKLIDCSYVQPYTINSAKVIFLKPRPQSRPFKGSGNICLTCDRILQEPFHFCCLSCKVDHVMLQGEDLSSILFRYDESEFAFTHFENLRMDGSDVTEDDVIGQITPNSILEDPLHYNSCSGSSQPATRSHHHRRGSEVSDLPKRKKGGSFFPQIVLSLGGNRRKGAPHRSPLA
ncbi:PLATZ transcription factor family protein [Rhynchospora pubera]|uniref:PLATZ transcription factor family protein n=1 Tax=Rhynchospora pubera TaxID=906938 RepID=A0AAV8G953_9POAL|nr:PLATZ transcription factor family protein [Rhynchospora pubera]KAJ4799082.1 PLATZ transcription factor family protein [Rhynchospora pubera]KAJ4810797.1 PLATZ transcription factor family protein [Rhynchospora pubera]